MAYKFFATKAEKMLRNINFFRRELHEYEINYCLIIFCVTINLPAMCSCKK